MYSGMTPKALDWQKKIRKFVNDELIPWEVHAEKNNGELPKDIEKKHRQIAYFGILEEYFGKKCGGYLLTQAIHKLFEEGMTRVWLHTCSLDHENAIKNYLARGMQVFKSEKINVEVN